MERAPYTNFGALDFVFTEFQHDFFPQNTTLLTTNDLHHFWKLFKGSCGAACIVDPTYPDEVWRYREPPTLADDAAWHLWYRNTTVFFETSTKLTDEAIVQQIFAGRTKNELRNMSFAGTMTNGEPIMVFIKGTFTPAEAVTHWTGPFTEAGGWKLELPLANFPRHPHEHVANFRYHLNEYVEGNFRVYGEDEVLTGDVNYAFAGLTDIYIVSDAAKQVAYTLWESYTNELNVHCMFSSATYGDPQSDSHPWDTAHNRPVNNGARYDWICTTAVGQPNPQPRDPRHLMPIDVVHSWMTPTATAPIAAGDSTVIGKNITHELHATAPPQLDPLQYANATTETTKPVANNAVEHAPAGGAAPIIQRQLWTAQGKRLGDHEQVIFAKNLQYNNWVVAQGWHCIAGNGGVATNLFPTSNSANTFLATGDWPCFCYAIYNRINAILYVNSEWYVFRFT